MSVTKEEMQNLSTLVKSSTDGHLPAEKDEATIAAEAQAAAEAAAGVGEGEGLAGEEETAEEEAAAAAGEGEADEGLYTPTQLAEAIDWPVEDLYGSLVIPMDDGQPPVPLGEFKNNYQNLSRDHKALQDKFEEQGGQLQQASAGFGQGQQMSNDMVQAMGYLGQIQRMEEGTDWAELEELDPSQAVLKRQKFQQARADVQGEIKVLQQQQEAAKQQYLQQAGVKMLELIPTWSDAEAKKTDQASIMAHMRTAGFVDQEIAQIADPRVMMLLKELVDLRALKGAAGEAVKKVRNAPRVIAGRNRGAAPKKAEVTQAFVDKAKETGSKGDTLNAVKAILKGGQKQQ